MKRIKAALRLHFETGLSQRETAQALGLSHSTVGACLRRFNGLGLDWQAALMWDEVRLEEAMYPSASQGGGAWPLPDWTKVHTELKGAGVTLRLLWEEYRQENPVGYSYSRWCELYGQWKGGLKLWMRQSHPGGHKVFVDYSGKKPTIVDTLTGREREAELFVMSWASSHYLYAEAQESQKLPHFVMGHVRAFEYFGCCPELVVPDNLKSAVNKAHRYDPDANRSYEEMAAHYGVGVLPARPYKPRDKAGVETGVQIVQRWVLARLRHRTFFSLAELNEAIRGLLDELNDKPMQKLDKSRRQLFHEKDRPNARPLPQHPYRFRQWDKATVGLDYHVTVEKHHYSVPYALYGRRLDICLSEHSVEIFEKGKRVALHERKPGDHGHTTLKEHMPERHQNHVQWTPARITSWAGSAGKNTRRLIESLLTSKAHPEQGFRPALGIKRLGDLYGTGELEKAAAYALERGILKVDPIAEILKKKLYLNAEEETSPGTVIPKGNVRGKPYYQQKGETEDEQPDTHPASLVEADIHGRQTGGAVRQPHLRQLG